MHYYCTIKALLALDQLHQVFSDERRQEYYLNRIESQRCKTKTPVSKLHFIHYLSILLYLQFEAVLIASYPDLLTHPVMLKLTETKWNRLSRYVYIQY